MRSKVILPGFKSSFSSFLTRRPWLMVISLCLSFLSFKIDNVVMSTSVVYMTTQVAHVVYEAQSASPTCKSSVHTSGCYYHFLLIHRFPKLSRFPSRSSWSNVLFNVQVCWMLASISQVTLFSSKSNLSLFFSSSKLCPFLSVTQYCKSLGTHCALLYIISS